MLTGRKKLFADEWLTGAHTGKRFHGIAAYEFAGYKTSEANPSANPSKLLRHPEVQAYIQARLDEHTMAANEILLRMTEIARAEVGDVVTMNPANGDLKLDAEAVLKNKRFIKQFGFDSNGNPKIEFHDAVAVLRDLAKIRGLLKEGGLDINAQGGAVNLTVAFVNPDGSKFNPSPEDAQNQKEPETFEEFDDQD